MHFYIVCVLLTCGSQSWFYCFGIETPILTEVYASCDHLQRARHQSVSSNNAVYSDSVMIIAWRERVLLLLILWVYTKVQSDRRGLFVLFVNFLRKQFSFFFLRIKGLIPHLLITCGLNFKIIQNLK